MPPSNGDRQWCLMGFRKGSITASKCVCSLRRTLQWRQVTVMLESEVREMLSSDINLQKQKQIPTRLCDVARVGKELNNHSNNSASLGLVAWQPTVLAAIIKKKKMVRQAIMIKTSTKSGEAIGWRSFMNPFEAYFPLAPTRLHRARTMHCYTQRAKLEIYKGSFTVFAVRISHIILWPKKSII